MKLDIIQPDLNKSFRLQIMGGEKQYSFNAESGTVTIKNRAGELSITNPTRITFLKMLIAANVDPQLAHEMLQILGDVLQWENKAGLIGTNSQELDANIELTDKSRYFVIGYYGKLYTKPTNGQLDLIYTIAQHTITKTKITSIQQLLEFSVIFSMNSIFTQLINLFDKIFDTDEAREFGDIDNHFKYNEV